MVNATNPKETYYKRIVSLYYDRGEGELRGLYSYCLIPDEDVIEDFKFDFTTFDNFQFYLIYYGKN